jgi:phosphoribosylformimino-5-aminoimidazole carboxamide ribotide isomerase
MIIIPAIDIIDGKCVRLTKGEYSTKKIYAEDPLELALEFEDLGFTHLHIVDLDGAKANGLVNLNVVEQIASRTNLKIDLGGGIKSDKDLEDAFSAGVSQAVIGSLSVKNPELFFEWLDKYGSEKIVLGADAKGGEIKTQGWTQGTGLKVIDFIADYAGKGVERVICTDIDKDGMLQGPSVELYEQILERTELELVASGGIHSMKDLDELEKIGCAAAIVGKAIYEGAIELKKLAERC